MKVIYDNIGNVKHAEIEIEKNALNLKFGNNGIGKSTISKGLRAIINSSEYDIKELKTFGSNDDPSIRMDNGKIDSVLMFSDDYVNNFLFKEDLIRNTHEIIVNTPDYETYVKTLRDEMKDIMSLLSRKEVMDFLDAIETLDQSIKYKADGHFTDNSKAASGLKSGSIEANIPTTIPHREKLIGSDGVEYSKWLKSGRKFDDSIKCPYCMNDLSDESKECLSSICSLLENQDISKYYRSKELFENVSIYQDKDTKEVTNELINQSIHHTKEQAKAIKESMDGFKEEIEKIRILRNPDLKDILDLIQKESLSSIFASLCIDLTKFKDSPIELLKTLENVNSSIDKARAESARIEFEMKLLNDELAKQIQNNQDFVNNFLRLSGMPYRMKTVMENDRYRSYLESVMASGEIKNITSHLSYGERNSLSLLLFTLDAINSNPELIILDDPISSFDNNKKYAILHTLFSKDLGYRNLRNKTVLMVTHDFNIIVDLIRNSKPQMDSINAYYIYNEDGNLKEKKIEKDSIRSTIQIAREKAQDKTLPYVVRVLNFRRYSELKGDYGKTYDIMSAFLHSNETYDPERVCTRKELEYISKYINDFNYKEWLRKSTGSDVKKAYHESDCRYDKVILTRFAVMRYGYKTDPILWKYISETYHIENDTAYSLDSCMYNSIPDFIIEECDKIMKY